MNSAWEAIFMLLVLKIPVVYLALVVWWAIRAEPVAEGGSGASEGVPLPLTPCSWDDWKQQRLSVTRGRRPFRPGGPRQRRAREGSVTTSSVGAAGEGRA